MTEKLELYKCNICGNLVQILLNGVGELVCCGENMERLVAHTEENTELSEKHTPVFEKEADKTFVRLNYHPMVESHFIQFIEVISKDKKSFHLKYLLPNEKAEFEVTNFGDNLDAIEYCNIHGLWRDKNND